MANKSAIKRIARLKRKRRIRKDMAGTSERPRLSVFRSSNHIYAQIIDDGKGTTITSASSCGKEFKEIGIRGGDKKAAAVVGKIIGKRALDKGVKKVVFDRNGFLYHGRIKSLSDGAREAGLNF